MTEAEMEAAAATLSAIRAAKAQLARAQEVLNLVNKHGRDGTAWEVDLLLKRSEAYTYGRDIGVRVKIPFGVVQQQAVYAVQAARREVIRLGGRP